MKQTLLDLMTAMMPLMMPLVWIGGIAAAASILLLAARRTRFARWGAYLTVALGVFFLACQGMGALLGAQPSINFGDPAKFEFYLVAFWKIGLALLIPGTAVWALARKGRPTVVSPAA